VEATGLRQVGYIEHPSHYLHGLDSPVGIAFELTMLNGEPAPEDEASAGGWFMQAPENLHADLDKFLLERGYLQSY